MRKIWLFSKNIDLWLLALPVWLCWGVCFLVPESIHSNELPLWFWVVIIVGIDVSHVWSTIFRTYLDKSEFSNHKKVLLYAPLFSLVILFILASISIALFWTALAYIALYHFIKQQFGFMQLYKAKYGQVSFKTIISDKFAIYWSMLYPVFYWHTNTQRSFSWFVEGDFFNLSKLISSIEIANTSLLLLLNSVGSVVYFVILFIWLFQEVYQIVKHNLRMPIGKLLWVITTAGNWYLGIVYFNSDFAFSLTNVVAHGIPYLVLLFFYVERKKMIKKPNIPVLKVATHISFMLLIILLLAFSEEYFWDMFLFRDNAQFFESIINYPFDSIISPYAQALVFALLSLPQVTHYVLDGFIWKKGKKNPFLGKVLFDQ